MIIFDILLQILVQTSLAIDPFIFFRGKKYVEKKIKNCENIEEIYELGKRFFEKKDYAASYQCFEYIIDQFNIKSSSKVNETDQQIFGDCYYHLGLIQYRNKSYEEAGEYFLLGSEIGSEPSKTVYKQMIAKKLI